MNILDISSFSDSYGISFWDCILLMPGTAPIDFLTLLGTATVIFVTEEVDPDSIGCGTIDGLLMILDPYYESFF